jgi:hypothetical protein
MQLVWMTREEAIGEFGENQVEAVEMTTLMRSGKYPDRQQEASIANPIVKKHWRFDPTSDQLNKMTKNR